MAYILKAMLALAALAGVAAPARAQLDPAPPQVPLWRLEANGDAVQTDLGFILPARIQGFERRGFSSTRPDGASVMAHYESADGVKLRILLTLRGDVRGVPLPGADGVARNWSFVKISGDAFYPGNSRPETLLEGPLIWGNAPRPNGMMLFRRFRIEERSEIQGIWYRNIGLWEVIVIASGPEAKQAEVEAAGAAAMTIQWPAAPVSAELRAILPAWLPTLRECPSGLGRDGNGRPLEPGPIVASMIGMGLASYFMENPVALPHPVTHPQDYCLIERFRVGQTEITALGWTGDVSAYPAVRYAFVIGGGGVMYQFESFFTVTPAEGGPAGTTRLVWLTASNERRVAAIRVFTDWPSYAEARRMISESGGPQPRPVVEVTHPAGQIRITPINAGPLPPRPQGAPPHP
ncbi:MAG: hypothetical protein QOD42_2203 [Sphingomonadales bacterium]|nr:hypothetical protein [Sphingomonadales bacterium]